LFIKITRNEKGDQYYHLVESYRQEGKVKQRTLLPLGKVGDGKLEELATAISKHLDFVTIYDLAKNIDISQTYILGPLLVLEQLIRSFGIEAILTGVRRHSKRLHLQFEKIIFTLLCSRFIKPVSKLALYDHWLERMYPMMVNHDLALHHIYRSLDVLADHKEMIETNLYHYGKDLFSLQVDVVLYDLTTLRFESIVKEDNQLRQFGFSKEKRSDCTQIVLGLLTDTDGIPLCFEAHPGNTFEGHTLAGIVEKMKTKFLVRRFIFIADRGLFSAENLEHIRSSQGEFIVGMKMGSLPRKKQEQLYDIKKFEWINDDLAIRETTHQSDRLIITWSRSRADRDRKAREDIVDKIREKMAKGHGSSKDFVTNSNYKKYVHLSASEKCEINEEAIKEMEAKDGFFAIITNVTSMTATQLVTHYKQLWKIEDAFGEIKGTLKTRPVFHWTDKRITGHLVLCFLAYYLEAQLTKKLREQSLKLESKSKEDKTVKERQLTVVQVMTELSTVMAVPVKVKAITYWIRTDIPPNASHLLKAIGMRIPPKLLRQTT